MPGSSAECCPTHSQVYAEMSSTNGTGASRSVSVEQAEALLRSLAGVIAARIDSGPEGDVERIEIKADDATPPHQLVRNIQSALLATFGLLVEVNAIEVVEIESEIGREEPPAEAGATANPEQPGSSPNSPPIIPETSDSPRGNATPAEQARKVNAPRGHSMGGTAADDSYSGDHYPVRLDLIDQPSIDRLLQNRIKCRVEIAFNGATAIGQAEVLGGADAVLVGTARAVIAALRTVDPENAAVVELEGAREVQLAGQRYIIVGIRALELREVRYLAGAAVILESAAEAAALAAIEAVRQWIARRSTSKHHYSSITDTDTRTIKTLT